MTAEQRTDRRFQRLWIAFYATWVVVVSILVYIPYSRYQEQHQRDRNEYAARLTSCEELEKRGVLEVAEFRKAFGNDRHIDELERNYERATAQCINGARAILGKPPIPVPKELK